MKNILKFRLNRHLLSLAMGVGMLGVLVVGNVGTALADSPAVNLNVNGAAPTVSTGSFSLADGGNNITSTGLTLDGLDHTINITLPITATDASGSGLGWNVTAAATTVTTSGGTSHTLLDMPKVTTVVPSNPNVGTSSETVPTNATSVTSSFPLSLSSTANPVFSAAVADGSHTGMGQFLLTTTATLKIRADAYIPDTGNYYRTTLTVAINTGP